MNECRPKNIIEVFNESELIVSTVCDTLSNKVRQVNITHHDLVPKHVPLSEEDKRILLERYKVSSGQHVSVCCLLLMTPPHTS